MKEKDHKIKREEILRKYWFFHPEKPLTQSLMAFGLEVGDGWLDLIDELCYKLRHLIETKYPDYITDEFPFEVVQVKEKFGGLRFYTNYTNDKIEKLITKYERKSFRICERCGKKGKLRADLPWIQTLCKKCYLEINKI